MICCIWDFILKNASGISAVAAVAAVFITLWSLHVNRRVEKEKMRPIISVEIVDIQNVYNLVVRNIGLTQAFDIHVTTHPLIRIQLTKDLCEDIPFVKHPIPSLLPGAELKCGFIVGYDALKQISNEMRFHIDLKYQDRYGRHFDEKQIVDVRLTADSVIVKEGRCNDEDRG